MSEQLIITLCIAGTIYIVFGAMFILLLDHWAIEEGRELSVSEKVTAMAYWWLLIGAALMQGMLQRLGYRVVRQERK